MKKPFIVICFLCLVAMALGYVSQVDARIRTRTMRSHSYRHAPAPKESPKPIEKPSPTTSNHRYNSYSNNSLSWLMPGVIGYMVGSSVANGQQSYDSYIDAGYDPCGVYNQGYGPSIKDNC